MDIDKTILRLCACVLLCSLLFRLIASSPLGSAAEVFSQSQLPSIVLFLRTGRILRQSEASPEAATAPTGATLSEQTQAQLTRTPLHFSQEDGQFVEVNDYAGKAPDVDALLQKELTWDLTGSAPKVLILHTHATESYRNTEGYEPSSQYRTLEEEYNMLSIGAQVAQLLSQRGIAALHDKTLHDYPSYNGAYSNARQTIESYLSEYPSICLVLDLHRDAMVDSLGNQIGYTVATDGGDAAKVMLVAGAGHDGWEENMALAVKLQAQLEKLCPGICRPISLRKSKFNQDMHPGAILIEMGAAGNTRQEALLAAEYVAQAIGELAWGSQ